jgi:hypothetical protein
MTMARSIAVGDRVTGRCVTAQHDVTGTVAAILYPLGLGCFTGEPNDLPLGRRYLLDTSGRRRVVECAELLDPR